MLMLGLLSQCCWRAWGQLLVEVKQDSTATCTLCWYTGNTLRQPTYIKYTCISSLSLSPLTVLPPFSFHPQGHGSFSPRVRVIPVSVFEPTAVILYCFPTMASVPVGPSLVAWGGFSRVLFLVFALQGLGQQKGTSLDSPIIAGPWRPPGGVGLPLIRPLSTTHSANQNE